jgi:DNA-directed RNA polymerase III subunit RPC4
MGPSQPGSNGRRSASQSTTIDVAGATSSVGSNLSQTVPPPLRKEAGGKAGKVKIDDEEVYSDPDEGVEIVDMDLVRQMDWMAPEVLQKERQNIQKKVKKEENANDSGTNLVYFQVVEKRTMSDYHDRRSIRHECKPCLSPPRRRGRGRIGGYH